MRKLFAIFSLILILNEKIDAQQTEPLIAKIHYEFIYRYDKEDSSKKFDTNVLLLVGKNNSRYANAKFDFTEPLPDFVTNPIVKPDLSKIPVDPDPTAAIYVNARAVGNEFLFRLNGERKLVLTSTLGYQDYIIEMEAPEINWSLSDETLQIGDYICQKATGWYAGRHYTVWFAPSLPYPYGPWKLGGLPGLILSASDDTNSISFIFKDFSRGKNEFLYYDVLRPIKVAEKKYKKLKEQYESDPIAVHKSQLSPDTRIVEIQFYNEQGEILSGHSALDAIKKDSKIKITNPIELINDDN